jgi:hypothetical protein
MHNAPMMAPVLWSLWYLGLLGRVGLLVVVAMLALGATSYQVNSEQVLRSNRKKPRFGDQSP